MTLIEIAVIVFGLFAGYWVVSKLLFPAAKASTQVNTVRPPEPVPRWCDILQVSPAASALDIRDAYKHLISKYHPDKVDNLGQELKDLAREKSQEITAAYQEGMRARGEVS
jgi:preprotein translocase subunit Sec63